MKKGHLVGMFRIMFVVLLLSVQPVLAGKGGKNAVTHTFEEDITGVCTGSQKVMEGEITFVERYNGEWGILAGETVDGRGKIVHEQSPDLFFNFKYAKQRYTLIGTYSKKITGGYEFYQATLYYIDKGNDVLVWQGSVFFTVTTS